MKGPPRLLEAGATEVERDLLLAGLAEKPSDRWLADTRMALGIATSVAGASSVVSGVGGAKLGGAAMLKWIGIWFAIVAMTGSVTLVLRHQMRAASAIAPAVENRLPAPTGGPMEQPPAQEERGAPPESPAATTPRAERALVSPKTLSAEVAALDNVKQLLVAGDPVAALNALAKYRASFPAPILGPEATVLEVQALMSQGDPAHRSRAVALARRFVKLHPTSPHASQLEAALSKAREP